MRAARLALVALALGASPALAKGPMYAYRAGADEATLEADDTACIADARQAAKDATFQQPYMVNPVTNGTFAGSAGSALARGFAAGIASAKRWNTTLYDCLTARGYTMLRMSGDDVKMLKKLPDAERKAKMLGWRTGPAPVHPAITRDDID